jgi:hypothetical protein
MQNTAEDLRAEVARRRVHLYELAAAVGMHPGRLGAMLNEKLPLRPALAERVAEALRGLSARSGPTR